MRNFAAFHFIIILLFCSVIAFAQNDGNSLKNDALKQMQAGRYGEAIDLLNRYISAFPQRADGYNLRGVCYEKRAQYEQAVYDFKSAHKLDAKNKEIDNNLSRTTNSWYKLLNNKIEGHKREIAINPNKPVNYLEIGKCYKNLGQWNLAEQWYDDYLKREEASADEIIRYSEIIAKNGHLKKGEPILKKYTDKYPKDHRLWSRYGYFLFWLGKNKLAVDAFDHAIAIRPYFREALEGREAAKGKGYNFTVNDTTSKYNYGMPEVKQAQEYPIDRYYRLLKKDPKDNEVRFKLIEELVKNKRFAEAYDQIEIISRDNSYADKVSDYREQVQAERDSVYQQKIAEYSAILEKDPNNKEAVIQLADYYARLNDYEQALKILETYVSVLSDDKDPDVRFKYAQFLAWNFQFEPAIDQLNILLAQDKDNLDYQLLRAQIAVWTAQDLELAETYLRNVLDGKPDNIEALIALASMTIRQKKFDEAKELIERASKIDPSSKEVETVQIYYDSSLSNFEGLKIYQILYDGREMVANGDCVGALEKYSEYFSKISGATRMEQTEYANVNVCAGNLDTAFAIYDRLLSEEYDFDVALLRAKAYLIANDSVKALQEFKKLSAENPDDYDTQVNLAAAYEMNHQYSKAEDVYESLIEKTTDSTQVSFLEQRIKWLPKSSFSAFISSFPTSVAFAPMAATYSDNQDFRLKNMGGRFEFGVSNFLTLGASVFRTYVYSKYSNQYLTSFKGQIFIVPSAKFSLSTGFGILNIQNEKRRNISDVTVRYQDSTKFSIAGVYENTDARLVLYSPNLLYVAYDANMMKLLGTYNHKSGLRFSGAFTYIDVKDGNKGNDLNLRIGRKYQDDLTYGYEYAYANYLKVSKLYYSPQNFDSHSVWGDWQMIKEDDFTIDISGKLGYIPDGDFIIREISGDLLYKPIDNLTISGKISAGSTYRDAASYNFVSGTISAYLSFH